MTAPGAERLGPPGRQRLSPRGFGEVVAHLVKREIDSTHRMTILGWSWPLVRQLAQLIVLIFIFGSVINLKIPHFPVYVFSGLVAWTWFSSGVAAATTSLLDQRHLVFQARLPSATIPIVAVVVPLIDALLALPILLILAAFEGGLHWTTVLLPVLVVVQLALMSGVAWLVSAASVYFRDVPNLVVVGLQILFYVTPVFYRTQLVPHRFTTVLDLNPMTTIVDGYRAALLGLPAPGPLRVAGVVVGSFAIAVIGFVVFTRHSADFVDSL